MKKYLVLFLFAFPLHVYSFFYGIHEGLMGNTGVATLDSKAASYYNPSLLMHKGENTYSVGGSTLGRYKSSDRSGGDISGGALTPTYLSAVFSSDYLMHELFIYNLISGLYDFRSSVKGDSLSGVVDGTINRNSFAAGYSLAFRKIPLALQTRIRYSSNKRAYFAESNVADENFPSDSLFLYKSQEDFIELIFGISHHFTLSNYTFGVNFNTRGIKMVSKHQNNYKGYALSGGNKVPISGSSSGTSPEETTGNEIRIGHGFVLNNHEFLTDSILVEDIAYKNKYILSQSFGYRLKVSKDYQYAVGVSSNFGNQLESFGQSLLISTGMILRSRTYLSSIGLGYLQQSNMGSKSTSLNLIFSSEFAY